MYFWNASMDDIESATLAVGVRVRFGNPKGRALSATIRTDGTGSALKYGRLSAHTRNKNGKRRRVPGAVCWHGHRDFIRALYRIAGPDVRVKTALADYRNRDSFEALYPTTTPTPCDCTEGGQNG